MSAAIVRREPLTYERTSRHSYFRDLWVRERDQHAADRLLRHAQEMDVVAAETEARNARGLARESEPGGRLDGVEFRVVNRTDGTGGYFAVPLWLNEMFATAPRAPRVLANHIPNFPLPDKVSAVDLPRLTTGNQALPQADNAVVPGQDIVDAVTTSAVVTISGKGDYSKQLLEQSPQGAHLDWAMFKDLSEAYDADLEYQLVNGAGAGVYNDTQLLGVLNVPGIDKETFSAGSPVYCSSSTLTNNLNTYIGSAGAAVGNNRKLPPEAIYMTTARWMWIATSVDNQSRPIVPPDVHPPKRHDGDLGAAVSTLGGWPVYVDDAIPTTINGNQDAVLFCRPSDMVLLEGPPKTMVEESSQSGTLGVRVVLHRYVAALTGRYPSGTSWITGAGLVTPSFTTAH